MTDRRQRCTPRILQEKIDSAKMFGHLDLAKMDLSRVPDEVREIVELTHLDLSYNNLTFLPEWIGELVRLESLEVVSNRLTLLPSSIGDLKNLTSLLVMGNCLLDLPESIGKLVELKELAANLNQLEALPERIGDLSSLELLLLNFNRIASLPDTIVRLKKLTRLEVQHNQLTRLPRSMSLMESLETLRLHSNILTEVPECLKLMPRLRMVELASNKITGALPDWFMHRCGSWFADMSGNQLTSIPSFAGDVPFCRIDLWGNTLNEPPQKIAEAGMSAIRAYFQLKIEDQNKWVMRSTLASLHLERKSRLAVSETICCSAALLALLAAGHSWPLLGIATVPLLLLRTPKSVACGTQRLGKLINLLRIRSGDLANHPLQLSASLITLGLGSLAIKILTAAQFAFRWTSVVAIPENFERQLTQIDSYSPPELVPGAEEAFSRDRSTVITAADLLTNFVADINFQIARPGARRRFLISLIGIFMLGAFFFLAWIYRFSLKATCLFYWPFLLINRYESNAQIAATVKLRKPTEWLKSTPQMTFVGVIGTVSLILLLKRQGLLNQAALIESFIPKNIVEQINRLNPLLPPKLIFTSLLLMSVFYFIGLIAMTGMAQALTTGGNENRSDFRLLRSIFKISAVGLNASVCVTTVYTFIWAWPLTLGHATEIFSLLF